MQQYSEKFEPGWDEGLVRPDAPKPRGGERKFTHPGEPTTAPPRLDSEPPVVQSDEQISPPGGRAMTDPTETRWYKLRDEYSGWKWRRISILTLVSTALMALGIWYFGFRGSKLGPDECRRNTGAGVCAVNPTQFAEVSRDPNGILVLKDTSVSLLCRTRDPKNPDEKPICDDHITRVIVVPEK